MNAYSDFLFARPSFIEGVSRALDIGGTLQAYNESTSPEKADAIALASDWCAIAEDFKVAIEQVELEKHVLLDNDILLQAKAELGSIGSLCICQSDGK
jgi:hypothetical protein